MFRRDYRTILRRFEYDRLLAPGADGRDQFGGRYANALLDEFFTTDARKLPSTFKRLNDTQRTLYTVNALVGQVANGGIAQFCFNAGPVLRAAVPAALERIDASDMLRAYKAVVGRLAGNDRLAAIRAGAEQWDDYQEFKAEVGGGAADNSFDDWYFAGQATALDRLMRAFIAGREADLVRFCDGHRRLEARWTRRRLGRLVHDYEKFTASPLYPFFDLLFTPACRERFGQSKDERRQAARVIADRLMPLIRRASRHPQQASFTDSPTPQIVIGRSGTPGGHGLVVVSYYEDRGDLLWSISHWG